MEFQDRLLPPRFMRAPLDMTGAEFRSVGHKLVDRIAAFLDGLPQRPVTPGEPPHVIRRFLGNQRLPEQGTPAADLLEQATDLLLDHSLFNGHPRFWGYITSSAAPIGALGDLLAAAVNPNVGAAILSPMATEIEAQTIRWIADLIGYPSAGGGLLVSGGNMANITCFLAGVHARVTGGQEDTAGGAGPRRPMVYTSRDTHGWIDKAIALSGLGADALRMIPTDAGQAMDLDALEEHIIADRSAGYRPFMVIGTAGSVGTGAIDPLPAIAALCRTYDLWFHVDGAYGAPAAVLPDAPPALYGLREADSVALDPHKWLYSPIEAGCALVRDPAHLLRAFGHHADYYNFDGQPEDPPINYLDLGLQNTRGFRALKVWLGLRQVGRQGYIEMIGDDIGLAQALFKGLHVWPELEAVTQHLSITTFRFVPSDLKDDPQASDSYLNDLNRALVDRLQQEGKAFISNAVVEGRYLLRACIVNFRTTRKDIEALAPMVVELGRALDAEMRPRHLRTSWEGAPVGPGITRT